MSGQLTTLWVQKMSPEVTVSEVRSVDFQARSLPRHRIASLRGGDRSYPRGLSSSKRCASLWGSAITKYHGLGGLNHRSSLSSQFCKADL